MFAESLGIDTSYLKQLIRSLNEIVGPAKQKLALRESKILSIFLVFISVCLVSSFLMAFYLHFAWAFLFAGLLIIGAISLALWLKNSD